jgi:hypothetical protein
LSRREPAYPLSAMANSLSVVLHRFVCRA